ncbi:hypothetical protein ACUR5C_13950 [Aliikangiella sp. IMCC44653]
MYVDLKIYFSLSVSLIICGCISINDAKANEKASVENIRRCPGVPLVMLLSDVPEYNNMCVTTTGVVAISSEWSYLYLNLESKKHGVTLNSLGLGFSLKESKILTQYNGQYITITGIYNNSSRSLSDVKFFTF